MIEDILAVAMGFSAGKYYAEKKNKTSDKDDQNEVTYDVGPATVPYNQYVEAIEKLNETRTAIANLILLNSKLRAKIATFQKDDEGVAVYKKALSQVQEKYDLLYSYVKNNVEGFVPEHVTSGLTVEGLHINPSMMFDRDKHDPSLYIDKNGCIAIRGIPTRNVGIYFQTPNGDGFIKTIKNPNEPTHHLTIDTNWKHLALRTANGNSYRIRNTSRRLRTTDRYIPAFLLEFDKSIDFHDFVGKIKMFTSTGNGASDHNNDNPNWSSKTVFIVLRRNVLLVRPYMKHSGHYKGQYKGHKGTLHLWSTIVKDLPIISGAVLNIPLAVENNGRPYPRNHANADEMFDALARCQGNW